MKNLIPSKAAIKTATKQPKEKPVKDVSGFRIGHNVTGNAPGGGVLFAYTIAVLKVAGMFTEGRKAQPVSAFNSAYKSLGAVKYHLDNGNVERTTKGGYRLTRKGMGFIKGRKHDSAAVPMYEAVIRGESTTLPQEAVDKGMTIIPRNWKVYK